MEPLIYYKISALQTNNNKVKSGGGGPSQQALKNENDGVTQDTDWGMAFWAHVVWVCLGNN